GRRDLHLMDALIFHVISWPTLGCALLVYGFAPGALLRLIVLLYPRKHPRRRELIGELYAYPRIMRPFWVAEQLETALFEGLHDRLAAWRARRLVASPWLPTPEEWEARTPIPELLAEIEAEGLSAWFARNGVT